ncbi:MAG: hypothetical protein M1814_001029 [Vezdaea aestivalis]|nr:MAG: hypothetical protein M1814_001029 [Vezdaea aestivalis]
MAQPSITSRVLEDGVWVNRTFTMDEILSGHAPPMKRPEPGPLTLGTLGVPKFGILTKSLVHSPVIHWIIPARIRGESFNDVLFVGENFVSVKQIQPNNRLKDIATKRNFHGRIRHAKVFGDSRKPASSHTRQFKTENGNGNARSSHSEAILGYAHIELPPQILVLSLDSGEIMFLFAINISATQVRFLSARRDIPASMRPVEQPGKLIAVDPRSRAMAISAQRNMIVIFALHSMSDIRAQVSTSHHHPIQSLFDPIREERIFTVDSGFILRMEFLYPTPDRPDHVMLILLISRQYQQFIRIYEWDTSESLRFVRALKEVEIRREEDGDVPLLLIPLIPSSSFLLVSELRLSIWTGIEIGPLQVAFSTPHSSIEKKDDSEPPLWTQWARPVRNKTMSRLRDCLYLSREDGLINFIEVESQSDMSHPQIASVTTAARFNCHVDTAFATLDVSMMSDDFLIAGGNMSKGGLQMIGPNKPPAILQSLHNWTAISDICVAPKPSSDDIYKTKPQPPSIDSFGQEALTACTGHNNNGAITQFRRGLEAQVMLNFDYFPGTSSIWAWADQEGSVFIVQSNAIASRLWLITQFTGDMKLTEVQEVEPDLCKLRLSKRTIAIGHFREFTFQITEDGIYPAWISSSAIQEGAQDKSESLPLVLDSDHSISAATVKSTANLILCAITTSNSTNVLLFSLDFAETMPIVKLASTPNLAVELSCISILELDNRKYFAVATSAGLIQLYSQENSQLVSKAEISVGDYGSSLGDSCICESICVLYEDSTNCTPSEDHPLLLCGLRNGDLLCFAAEIDDCGNLGFQRVGQISIGVTPVVLSSDDQYPGEILMQCGLEYCHIAYDKTQKAFLQINRVWLTNVNEAWHQPQEIAASCRIGCPINLDNTRGPTTIACVAGGEVNLLALSHAVETIPRTFPIHEVRDASDDEESPESVDLYPKSQTGGTPRKGHYSEHLGLLVVAYSNINELTDEVHSSLKFFQLESGRQVSDDGELSNWSLDTRTKYGPTFGRPSERIMGMIDFFYNVNGSRLHYLVVHTGLIRPHDMNDDDYQPRDCGRLLFLDVQQIEPDKPFIEVQQKMVYKQNDLISAIVMLRLNVLVWASNRMLLLREIDGDTAKWNSPVLTEIPSRIQQLSVDNGLLYVSTFHGMFHVFRYDNSTRTLEELVRRSDARPDWGFTQHLQLPGSPFVILNRQRLRKLEIISVHPDHGGAAHLITETTYDPPLSRFSLCRIRPRWRPRPSLPVLAYSNPDGRDIIGTSLNGTVQQISLLLPQAWRVVRFIENLARFCVDSDLDRSTTAQLDLQPRSNEVGEDRIDGDLIAEEVVNGGIEHFRAMLQGQDERLLRGVGCKYRDMAAANEKWLLQTMKKISPREGDADYVAIAFQLVQELVGPIW